MRADHFATVECAGNAGHPCRTAQLGHKGGFMRRYSDHAFHESVNQKRSRTRDHPCADDWWKIQCGGQTSRPRRVYFSEPPA
jgi:hypothetical protein